MPAVEAPRAAGAADKDSKKVNDTDTSANAASKAAALEEDDEFEDFPVDNWTSEETDAGGDSTHLWEESWDDDDTTDDFSAQLKEELKKVETIKKG